MILMIVIWAAVFNAASSLNVSMNARHLFVDNLKDVVNVSCTTHNVAIASCQFTLWDGFGRNELERIDEISMTMVQSLFTAYNLSTEEDLKQGVCQVSLTAVTAGRYVVGCRVREVEGDWFYDYATLQSYPEKYNQDYNVSIDPEVEVFVSKGSNLNVKCTSNFTVDSCAVDVGNITERGKWATESSSGKFILGLFNKACHVTLLNVSDMHSGVTWCNLTGKTFNVVLGTTVLVQKPPTSNPQLTLSKDEYSEGDVLTATCRAGRSLPRADITWLLDDQEVAGGTAREVAGVDVCDDAWRWRWTPTSRTQTFKKTFTAADEGRTLTCRVNDRLKSSIVMLLKKETTSEPSTAPVSSSSSPSPGGSIIPDTHTVSDTTSSTLAFVIGGVVAGIIVLCALALVLYARFSQRWCFAGAVVFLAKPSPSSTLPVPNLPNNPPSPEPNNQTSSDPAAPSARQHGVDLAPDLVPADHPGPPAVAGATQHPGPDADRVIYSDVITRRDSRPAQKPAQKVAPEEVVYAELNFVI